jgi:glyoxylase-like metal-dependent hydrolase (beta-lactamase superfamily II)
VHLAAEFGVPIVAHPVNDALLEGILTIDEHWEDGQVIDCGGRALKGHHTPGHAKGHLVFQDVDSSAMIAGDMVAGIGTILIDPADGDLGHYLDSLQRMRDLNASVLLPAHGDPLPHADQLLSFYIAHRHSRTDQFRQALDTLGEATPLDIAVHVYASEIDPQFFPLAAIQVLAHLLWMESNGLARPTDGERWVRQRPV